MADDSELISQGEIEDLLNQAKGAAQQAPPTAADPAVQGAVPQNEINPLLRSETGAASSPAATQQAAPPPSAASPSAAAHPSSNAAGDDIQLLLDQAEDAIATVNELDSEAASVAPFQFRDFAGSPASEEKATIDLLRDVELDLKIELGRTHMELEEVLKLRRGSVVALDKLAGDPVDVYVNGRLVARGEVLVLNDNFCVRVAELISGDD